jgi:hypothetical protein
MLETFLNSPEIMNALITLVALAVTSLVSILSIKVNSYIDTIKNERVKSITANAYDHLSKVVEDAVLYTKQTLVDDIKAYGKLDGSLALKAVDQARRYTLEHASKAMLEVLNEEFGDLDDLIIGLIEAKVGKLKK